MPRKKKTNGDNPIGIGLTTKQMKRKKPISNTYLLDIEPITDNQKKLFDSYFFLDSMLWALINDAQIATPNSILASTGPTSEAIEDFFVHLDELKVFDNWLAIAGAQALVQQLVIIQKLDFEHVTENQMLFGLVQGMIANIVYFFLSQQIQLGNEGLFATVVIAKIENLRDCKIDKNCKNCKSCKKV